MRLIVVAVPGAGKSTILGIVKSKLPDVTVVNYGDYMFDVAKRRYGITHRDEMRRKLPLSEYRRVQEIAAEEIAKLPGDTLIDTHAAIRMGGGFYPGLPSRIVERLMPDAIIVLEFNPMDIIQRRMKDEALRIREKETPQEIELHQLANRHYAFAAANEAECPVYILDFHNKVQEKPFQHAEEAAAFIVDLLIKNRQSSLNAPQP
ncbi:adenylate kinase [Caldivirga sp. UBA161]|uniref:adenylate kinase n=1 Tax=Caldivirga sp. UBA161 TaxID=1915569 RepID=UPI0025BB57FD|nr:adenylate kinase [Caldivirga sp. UBA161]